MGIYIPNIDKPKSCAECELWSLCFYPKAPKEIDDRVMPDCPLEEIEEWNSYSNGKIYAPKGTFQKIYDAERRNDE